MKIDELSINACALTKNPFAQLDSGPSNPCGTVAGTNSWLPESRLALRPGPALRYAPSQYSAHAQQSFS